jgi:hypothetical protein
VNRFSAIIAIISGFGLISAAYAQTGPTVPPGFTVTSFFGTPIVMPLLATYMGNWEQAVENQSILSLVNQGDTTPAALGSEAMAVAQAFCAATSNAPVPDCANPAGVAGPIAAKIELEAAMVPASQWSAGTYSPQQPSTLALAVALATAEAAPPPVPPTGPVVGACYQVASATMCYPGPGASLTTITNGQQVTQSGVVYIAHITQGLMGPSLWFSPAPAAPAPAVRK